MELAKLVVYSGISQWVHCVGDARGRLAGRALSHPLSCAVKIQASLTAHWHDKGADWRGLAHTQKRILAPSSPAVR